MGSTVSVDYDTDSPTTPGEKSAVTSEIQGVTADKLFGEVFDKFVRAGKLAAGGAWQVSFDVTDRDGGVLTTENFEAGGQKFSVFVLYKFDPAKLEMTADMFLHQNQLDRGTPKDTGVFKVLVDPVRIEHYGLAHKTRAAGPMVKGLLAEVLQGLGASEVVLETWQSSPSDANLDCVLAGPIEGAPFDADSFFDKYRDWKRNSEESAELPDGLFVDEKTFALDFLGVAGTSYSKTEISEKNNHIIRHEYGTDETMTTVGAETHWLVHKDPFRIEAWNESIPCRRASEKQLKEVFENGFLKRLLEFMKECE